MAEPQEKKTRKHTPRSSAAEVDARVAAVARLLVMCNTASQVHEFCRREWGVHRATSAVYIQRARAIIREDYSIERMDFIAARLGALDKIVQESINSGQHSNAIGAIRLASELTQTLGGKK